jgi:outer membrane protein OmpA-like peptidoglycan-associated protein
MSREKAGFVYKKLVQLGVARERAGYSGYGPAFPMRTDSTYEALALNNRIVLTRKM